jgi:predicted PurR-regulated permease PerM
MAEEFRKPGWFGPVVTTVIAAGLVLLVIDSFLSFVARHTISEKNAQLSFYLTLLAITGAMGGVIFGLLEANRTLHFK